MQYIKVLGGRKCSSRNHLKCFVLFLRAGKEFKNRTHGSKGSRWKRALAGNYDVMGNYGSLRKCLNYRASVISMLLPPEKNNTGPGSQSLAGGHLTLPSGAPGQGKAALV